jgi:hypothetical protein
MEEDSALAGAPGVVVLAAETAEDADASVVHANGDAEMVLPQGLPEKVPGGSVKLKEIGHGIELFLGHLERVESLHGHIMTPCKVLLRLWINQTIKPGALMIVNQAGNSK